MHLNSPEKLRLKQPSCPTSIVGFLSLSIFRGCIYKSSGATVPVQSEKNASSGGDHYEHAGQQPGHGSGRAATENHGGAVVFFC